jgi:Icc-related predicted phosphoesterase
MKITIISDTHNKHKQLILPPDTDVDTIIHCGDFTSVGKGYEIINFFKWFSNLSQYKYKICIAGNHDWLFEKNKQLAKSLIPDNVIYLEDSGVKIEGIKFYGTPVQKIFYNWAFNRSEEKLEQYWKAIPNDIDVFITHSPPYMIGDYVPSNKSHQGSPTLYKEIVERIKPRIHAFGHIHEGYGVKVIDDTTFINASNLNDKYECVNDPITIEI